MIKNKLMIGKTPNAKQEKYNPLDKPGYFVDETGKFKNWASYEDITWMMTREYLNVSYAEKDNAKNNGAKWDKFEKLWYIDNTPFNKKVIDYNFLSKYPKVLSKTQQDLVDLISKYDLDEHFYLRPDYADTPPPKSELSDKRYQDFFDR